MASIRKAWRWVAVASAAALALALVTSAFAQAPPSPPHQFFGSAGIGSGALVDGAAAADGAVVTALNQDGESVGTATIADGTWLLAVDAAATGVTFSIDGSAQTASFPVVSGDLTEVTIDVTSDAPAGLPNTGSGGLADTSGGMPLLPVALAIAAVVALGGVAVTRRAQLGVR